MGKQVWISICSIHQTAESGCGLCEKGEWVDQDELAAGHELFQTDYATWFAGHNNGAAPSDSHWRLWEELTGKSRPFTNV